MIELYAPSSYWRLYRKVKEHKIIPNTIWFLDISEANKIHTYCYNQTVTIQGKEKADRILLNNLTRLIESNTKYLRWIRKRKALKYYLIVKYFGGPLFWKGKNRLECLKKRK